MGQYDFDFKKYDVGGYNAIAGDGKLTGDEVSKAKKDGFETVWDGYTSNDKIPENVKKAEAEAKAAEEKKAKAFDFAKYDIGGNNAIAGDRKLTGDEVIRANSAGYENVYEGTTSDQSDSIYESWAVGTPFVGLTRLAARHTESKALRVTANVVDCLLLPITLPIAVVQRMISD